MTARRKYRSSRKCPFSISSSRFLFVAAMTRTSTLTVRADPRRSTSPSCRTRRTFACVFWLMSPTSSRKIVPRSACSNLPTCFSVAPVNDPFSCPNSSDSISSSGIAAQLTWTKRSRLRRLLRWMERATSSLPAPLSPSRSTVALVGGALERAVLVLEARRIERVADRDQDALAGQRLLDEIERAELGRLDGGAD